MSTRGSISVIRAWCPFDRPPRVWKPRGVIDAEHLGRLSLFADLERAQLEAVAHDMDEEMHAKGARILREGLAGGSFYVITDGEAIVRVAGEDVSTLRAGDFFGEISILIGEPLAASVVVSSDSLRCAVLPGAELRPLLLRHPTIGVRMLEILARRLRTTTLWQRA